MEWESFVSAIENLHNHCYSVLTGGTPYDLNTLEYLSERINASLSALRIIRGNLSGAASPGGGPWKLIHHCMCSSNVWYHPTVFHTFYCIPYILLWFTNSHHSVVWRYTNWSHVYWRPRATQNSHRSRTGIVYVVRPTTFTFCRNFVNWILCTCLKYQWKYEIQYTND